MFGECCDIAGTVNDTDDHHRLGLRQVVDGVGMMEHHPQARRELRACRTGKREVPQRLEGYLDRLDEARGDRLRCFRGERSPDFGKIGFRRGG
jgi:hypothetical protein